MTHLRGLDSVRVEKSAVLERLEENYQLHMADYEEAIEGWRLEVRDVAEMLVGALDVGDYSTIDDDLTKMEGLRRRKPHNYEDDYTSAIEMLKASLDDELELSQREFNHYMLDRWDWKESFNMSTSRYK